MGRESEMSSREGTSCPRRAAPIVRLGKIVRLCKLRLRDACTKSDLARFIRSR